MAEEEKKKSPVPLIAALVVIGLILAGGISYYIATKVMVTGVERMQARDPGVFVKLGDPKEGIIVNVGGVKSGRFLKVGIVLEVNPARDQAILDGKVLPAAETKILDAVLQVLRSQKVEDFDPNKQEELKTLIKDELNKVIGEGFVYEVYITNFVLQ